MISNTSTEYCTAQTRLQYRCTAESVTCTVPWPCTTLVVSSVMYRKVPSTQGPRVERTSLVGKTATLQANVGSPPTVKEVAVIKTRGKRPTNGGHTGTETRSTQRSTQTDTPGPAAATSTWNNTGPCWTGGGPDTTPETAPGTSPWAATSVSSQAHYVEIPAVQAQQQSPTKRRKCK